MDPVLARVLVNLSALKPGESIIDPFCGTGGILIEAGLCGISVNGFDMQKEMVKGCKKNLEEYGIINYNITDKKISKISETELNSYNAIVTDLPYGKSSKKTEEVVNKFLNVLESFDGSCVFMYNESNLGDLEADFSIYVHKNLTRYIYVI